MFNLDMVAQRHIENGLTAGGIDHHPLGAQRLVGQKIIFGIFTSYLMRLRALADGDIMRRAANSAVA